MEIFINSPLKMYQYHWKFKKSIVSIYRTVKVTNACSMYLAYDLKGNKTIYIPFKFYPNCKIALLRKAAFNKCQDMLTYIDNFPEKKIFFEHANVRTFLTTVNTRTIWVAEVFRDLYATFYTENLNVSLMGKNLLSCGYALCRAEQFIKGTQ